MGSFSLADDGSIKIQMTNSPSVLFSDAEGDPADVSLTAAADGTSAYSARRDHRHVLNEAITPAWTGQHQFAPAAAAAPFTLNANAQGQLVTGLNADQVDGYEASAFVLAAGDTLTGNLSADAGVTVDGVDVSTVLTEHNADGTHSAVTATSLTVDTTTLVVDDTNNRVGIKTNTPSNDFEVNGLAVSGTGTYSGAIATGRTARGGMSGFYWSSTYNGFEQVVSNNLYTTDGGITWTRHTGYTSMSLVLRGAATAHPDSEKYIAFFMNNSATGDLGTELVRINADSQLLLNTTTASGQLTVNAKDASTVGLVVNNYASTTANIAEFQVDGTVKLKVGKEGILDYTGTMGNSTKTVGTDAPADWIQVAIGGTTYYVPVYAA